MAFSSLRDLLTRSLRTAGIDRQVRAAQAVDAFGAVVAQHLGAPVAAQAAAVHLRDGVLTVRCGSSAMAQELKLRERELLATLNERVGGGVERLHFIQG